MVLWDGLQAPIHPLKHQQDFVMGKVLNVHLLGSGLQAVHRHMAECSSCGQEAAAAEACSMRKRGGCPSGKSAGRAKTVWQEAAWTGTAAAACCVRLMFTAG